MGDAAPQRWRLQQHKTLDYLETDDLWVFGWFCLYLDTEINAVARQLNTLKARMTAPDTKEQRAAVTAEVEHLKATKTRLRAEVKKIKDPSEALKAVNFSFLDGKRGKQT